MAGLVKHYQNTMKGIPQLTNNWGAMINLLDAVLVNGFNHVTILGLTKTNTASITATINLGSDHGFIDRQVVRIAGSTNGWNGDYKILSADANSITIECTAEHPSVISGTATCFTAPLDFEIVHQTPSESTEPKRAYRSTDPESLSLILLVHDFCSPGAAATGSKFAKVGIVSSMSDIDTITGTQMPFNSATPNANWEWDGTHHGWSKWYYRTPSFSSVSNNQQDSSPALSGGSPFSIVGDGVSFLFDVYTSNQGAYCVFGVAEFFDQTYWGKNLALLAFGFPDRIPQSEYAQPQARGSYVLSSDSVGIGANTVRCGIWFDKSGISNYNTGGYALSLRRGRENSGSGITQKNIYIDLPLIDNADEMRGYLPFLKMCSENITKSDVGNTGKYVIRYSSTGVVAIKYALFLETR
ncbi:hypothetical protein [Acinetobacter towneri]|uniref:hypothetical protein n=1 Tax=Acinetobacter towneri TaxID=202956 RepID=UPI002097B38E|nr:hypothetical protein [Acinetobacter towneri]MCO8059126.1 hypothetical protein [Acinetobacter towneri]MCO8064934.1 hypothetical protein [Acinetobacter towneri]